MRYYHEKVETDKKMPARIFLGGSGMDKLRYPLHWHHNLEFDLVLEGSIRGRIGGKDMEVKAGEVFFVNSGELHETDARGDRMRSITVLLSDELLREYCPELDSYYFVIEKDSSQQRQLAGLIKKCGKLFYEKREYNDLELSIVLRELCLVLLRECRYPRDMRGIPNVEYKSTKRIKEAISYMEDNHENSISVEDMGAVMGMSPSYFSRFFRQTTGQTFHSYLTQIRLLHARRFLEEEESVTETALNCGFPNVKSFIEAFKKEYGMTPAKYRGGLLTRNEAFTEKDKK